MSAAGAVLAVLAALVGPGHVAAAAPPKPTVSGPRETTSQRPTFTFRSRGAARFRCAFDSPKLHGCPSRYTQVLRPGRHVLRVRAVSSSGAQSALTTVVVLVKLPLPPLPLAATTRVGAGAGVPAVGREAVWVPNTKDGTLSRVDPASGAVTATTLGARLPAGAEGYLDSAVVSSGSVWVARDFAGEVVRVAEAAPRVVARFAVPPRPGGLTTGGGYVWAFHFLDSRITRIDPRTGTASTLNVPRASATGIAFGGDALWLLTVRPSSLLKLDAASGAVLARVPIAPPVVPKRGFIETWWLAFGEGSLWLTNPNYDVLTRVSAATATAAYVRLPLAQPFSVAVGGGFVWAVGAEGIVKIDPATNRAIAVGRLPRASSGFMQVAFGDTGPWVTNYDLGTLYRVGSG